VSESVVEATQAQVNAGTATGIFVSPAKLAAWGGIATALGYTPLNRAGDTATNLLLAFSSYSPNSAGYMGAPVNEQDGSYTLQQSDAGKLVRSFITAAATYTVPPNAFQLGNLVMIRNAATSSATLTVARGTGVAIYGAGGTTSKDWALAPGALATIGGEANNTWWISGAGIS
jgi:hypothetical protein